MNILLWFHFSSFSVLLLALLCRDIKFSPLGDLIWNQQFWPQIDWISSLMLIVILLSFTQGGWSNIPAWFEFSKRIFTQHSILQGSISRIWNGWTPDKIYPISWKQWKRRKREGNLWKSEKRSVVMEIRWAEWPRRKVCRTMKNLGYCFDSLSTRPTLPSIYANIIISICTRGPLLQTELRTLLFFAFVLL